MLSYDFKNKKITMLGLGVLGRGVNVAIFLAKHGAQLTITDLKTKDQLSPSLKKLKKFTNIKYVLGHHDLADFKNADMVIKAAGVPLDSPYIEKATKNGIPVEMDASLFAKLSEATIVGVTGTRGKSTVTHLIYEIIKNSGKTVFLGGNVRGLATLPLLSKAKAGDIVVMELDSWQLQGFGDSNLSPHIAVFTSFMRDHMNYYKNDMMKYFEDKANIFKYQSANDFLVVRNDFLKNAKDFNILKNLAELKSKVASKVVVAKKNNVPTSWKVRLLGDHNLENISAAVAVCRLLRVKDSVIKKTVEGYKGVPGRMAFIKEVKSVKYYNDTTATTPDGVIAGLKALKKNKGKIVLIGGGTDKMLEYDAYSKEVKKRVKALVLFKGTATDKIVISIGKVKFPVMIVDNMKSAIAEAQKLAQKGDIILLSPGATSFGIFKNEFDRGDQFCKIVNKIQPLVTAIRNTRI